MFEFEIKLILLPMYLDMWDVLYTIIHCSAEYTLRNIAQHCATKVRHRAARHGACDTGVPPGKCLPLKLPQLPQFEKNEFIYEANLSWKWGGFNFGLCLPPLAATSLNQNVSDTT
jgi:hypothetical protein